MSDADLCRKNGWKVGTILSGNEKIRGRLTTSWILITAIGEELVLAREIRRNGIDRTDYEGEWSLTCRKWREVKA